VPNGRHFSSTLRAFPIPMKVGAQRPTKMPQRSAFAADASSFEREVAHAPMLAAIEANAAPYKKSDFSPTFLRVWII